MTATTRDVARRAGSPAEVSYGVNEGSCLCPTSPQGRARNPAARHDPPSRFPLSAFSDEIVEDPMV
jgi:hypothetical protein